MFNAITIRPNSYYQHPIDFGQIIENLFFYQKTIAHVGRHEIKHLFDMADVDVLVELLKYNGLSIFYNNSHAALGNIDGIRFVDSLSLAHFDLEKELYQESFAHRGDAKKSKKFAHKLARLIKEYNLPKNFNQAIINDFKNKTFTNKILADGIRDFQPKFVKRLDEFKFELEFIDNDNFRIHTNFDSLGVDPKQFTPDSVLIRIASASEDLQVMAENNSEISTSEQNAKVIQAKIKTAIDQGIKSKREIEVFSHYVFDDSWALREAINKKHIHVKAVIQILRKADRYKQWLQELPGDTNLIREYLAKVEEKSILERMPVKAIRFYLFTALGEILNSVNPVVGMPVAVAASAFDTFLLERLGQQWKPSQFIENELRPLVKTT